MAPITLIAPPGTVAHAVYPATVGGSPVNVGTQVLEATVMALSGAMPNKAIAAWGRRRGHYIFGTDPRTGERYVQTTTDADVVSPEFAREVYGVVVDQVAPRRWAIDWEAPRTLRAEKARSTAAGKGAA